MTTTEGCPLCPASGFPHPPSSSSTPGDAEAEELWIACSKCAEWYHTACVALSADYKATIPELALAEIQKAEKGAWMDWADWTDRWHCTKCVAWSVDPTNPRPPHHPLSSTLKSSFNPHKRAASPKTKPGSPKRPRASASASAPAEDKPEKPSRPKRKAAENAPDYYAWNHGIAAPTTKWLKLISEPEKYGADIVDGDFPTIPGGLLSKEWLDSSPGDAAWNDESPPSLFVGPDRRPLLVKKANGGIESMGGHLPNKDLKITDIATLVSPDRMVDVIDVATQSSSQWTLQKWADYFTTASDPEYNGKVYNVISLEITGTPLARRVKPPRIVREIDWVENCWHFGPGGKTALGEEPSTNGVGTNGNGTGETNGEQPRVKVPNTWPKVQLYCLMGIRGSWTDWHVDFAASSVYYSIHTGAKEFYFIRPTEANLKAYAEWSGSADLQQNTWLGSMCEGPVERVRIEAGETMMIPAGYIHAVYTPRNAIVFGGNFVHSYNIPTQLRLRQIEIDTKVPQRFRFPQFDRLCWYVAEKACAQLRQLRAYRQKPTTPVPPPPIILQGLLELAKFLQSQIDILEDTNAEEKRRKLVYDRIPGEMVKDGPALAKELLWRVQRELPVEEAKEEPPVKSSGKAVKQKPKKVAERLGTPVSRIVNNQSDWAVSDMPSESSSSSADLPRPGSDISSQAIVSREVRKQKRSRQLHLEDGSLIKEEQEVIVIDTRTTWEGKAENGAVKRE